MSRRRAFNLNQRGYPVAIARVKSAQDVSKCVKFAEKHQKNVGVCVASGCHSSKCMMTGAFVIDLVYMNEVCHYFALQPWLRFIRKCSNRDKCEIWRRRETFFTQVAKYHYFPNLENLRSVRSNARSTHHKFGDTAPQSRVLSKKLIFF